MALNLCTRHVYVSSTPTDIGTALPLARTRPLLLYRSWSILSTSRARSMKGCYVPPARKGGTTSQQAIAKEHSLQQA